jgi:cytochrome c-type protein NapB
MHGSSQKWVFGLLFPLLALLLAACGDGRWVPVPGDGGAVKSSVQVRAQRRLYRGAPPTIPHENFGVSCSGCHDADGISVPELGFAPASPHDDSPEAGATQRCRQCHVFVKDDGLFVASAFEGVGKDLRTGGRLYPGAPPTIPHRLFLRENCLACHTGPGAREEIRTSHPERERCRQCHVPLTTRGEFTGGGGGGGDQAEERGYSLETPRETP